ncbi:MAG: hypothetical protein WAM73_04500 [Desulfobacterales bacterium]
MNGLFNMNFLMTFALAKNAMPQEPANNQLMLALAGGQSKNLLGPILLKVGAMDKIGDLEQRNSALALKNAQLQAALAECQKTDTLTDKISTVMNAVRAKKTIQDLKDDEPLLKQVHQLAAKLK